MFSLFRKKSQSKVFMDQDDGSLFFLVEVFRDDHSLTFLRLQSTPRIYKNFVLSANTSVTHG